MAGTSAQMLRAAMSANGRRRLSRRGLGEDHSEKLALILSIMCANRSWKHGLKLWDWKSLSPGRASHIQCRQHHHYLSTSSGSEAFFPISHLFPLHFPCSLLFWKSYIAFNSRRALPPVRRSPTFAPSVFILPSFS